MRNRRRQIAAGTLLATSVLAVAAVVGASLNPDYYFFYSEFGIGWWHTHEASVT